MQTTFEDYKTPIVADWLNDVDHLTYFTQTGTGAIRRQAEIKLREYRNVKDFGAVGDGVANDTVAIQNCINAGDAYIPAGNYRITSTILIPNDRIIHGDGYASRVFADSTFVPIVMSWAGGVLPVMFGNAGIVTSAAGRNITVTDIFSDWTGTAPGQCHHVHMRNTTGCKVHRCHFNAGADGTAFTMSSYYEVTSNKATNTRNCAYDQWENSHDGLVHANHAIIAFGYGMLATGDTSLNTVGNIRNIVFTNNIIIGDGTSNSGAGLWLQSGSNGTSTCLRCVAKGNQFYNFDVGIRATGGGKHIVNSNTIYNCKVFGVSFSYEVLTFGTQANILSDNLIEISGNATGAPIGLQGNVGSCIVTGNRVVNNAGGATHGITLDTATSLNYVYGNNIDPGSVGIFSDLGTTNIIAEKQAFVEGVFVPQLVSSGGGIPVYAAQFGSYQRIGSKCYFNLRVSIASLNSLAAGNMTISGLPYTSKAINIHDISPVSSVFSNLQAAITSTPFSKVGSNTTSVTLLKWASGSNVPLTLADISGTTEVNVAGSYNIVT